MTYQYIVHRNSPVSRARFLHLAISGLYDLEPRVSGCHAVRDEVYDLLWGTSRIYNLLWKSN